MYSYYYNNIQKVTPSDVTNMANCNYTTLSVTITWKQYTENTINNFSTANFALPNYTNIYKIKQSCPQNKTPKYAVCKIESVIPSVMEIVKNITGNNQVPIILVRNNGEIQQILNQQSPNQSNQLQQQPQSMFNSVSGIFSRKPNQSQLQPQGFSGQGFSGQGRIFIIFDQNTYSKPLVKGFQNNNNSFFASDNSTIGSGSVSQVMKGSSNKFNINSNLYWNVKIISTLSEFNQQTNAPLDNLFLLPCNFNPSALPQSQYFLDQPNNVILPGQYGGKRKLKRTRKNKSRKRKTKKNKTRK